ncbi:MAG: hypothetical protein U0271_33430 [Polyangiaceae bacterium]
MRCKFTLLLASLLGVSACSAQAESLTVELPSPPRGISRVRPREWTVRYVDEHGQQTEIWFVRSTGHYLVERQRDVSAPRSVVAHGGPFAGECDDPTYGVILPSLAEIVLSEALRLESAEASRAGDVHAGARLMIVTNGQRRDFVLESRGLELWQRMLDEAVAHAELPAPMVITSSSTAKPRSLGCGDAGRPRRSRSP